MKLEKEVVREIWKMAAGCLACTLAVLAGFFVFGRLDYRVLLGALIGWALAVGNFLLMSLGVVWALEGGDERGAEKKMRLSYTGRTLLMIVVLATSLGIKQVHWLPVFASVFYPRLVITVVRLLQLARVRRQYLAGVDGGEMDWESFEGWAESRDTATVDMETADAFDKRMESFFRSPDREEEKTDGE